MMCIVGRTNKEWIQILWYMSTGKDMSARGGALVAAKRACAQWNMRNSESDIYGFIQSRIADIFYLHSKY